MGEQRVYNVGLSGTGYLALKHLEAMAGHPRVRCLALHHTPRSSETARGWRQKFGVGSTTDDYAELLSSPEVDLIWVCSPNERHFEQTERALRAGKHVFCEKPLALSAAEAARLDRMARDSGLTLAVGMNCRFRHQYVLAKGLAGSGRLGRLVLVRGTYLYNSERAIREGQKAWWSEPANQPLLLTSGLIHTLDLLVWVAGEVSEVAAFGADAALGGLAGDDTLVISLRFGGGVVGELVASFAAVRPSDLTLELYGEAGSVVGGTLITRGQEEQFRPSRLEVSQPVPDLGLQLENVVAALDGVAPVLNGAARAARNMRVCEAVRESLARGAVVPVGYDDLGDGPG